MLVSNVQGPRAKRVLEGLREAMVLLKPRMDTPGLALMGYRGLCSEERLVSPAVKA